jgi:hypothetical protein
MENTIKIASMSNADELHLKHKKTQQGKQLYDFWRVLNFIFEELLARHDEIRCSYFHVGIIKNLQLQVIIKKIMFI